MKSPGERRDRAVSHRAWTKGLAIGAVIWLATGGQVHAFELTSPDVPAGQRMPDKFVFNGLGCAGENMSPTLSWSTPPDGTKSFALMVHDPDAVTGGAGIWHWAVVNIPETARSIEQGAGSSAGTRLPLGSRQIANDYAGFGISPGWGGP